MIKKLSQKISYRKVVDLAVDPTGTPFPVRTYDVDLNKVIEKVNEIIDTLNEVTDAQKKAT